MECGCIWRVWAPQSRLQGVRTLDPGSGFWRSVFSSSRRCSFCVASQRENHSIRTFADCRPRVRHERHCHDYPFLYGHHDGRRAIAVGIARRNNRLCSSAYRSARHHARSKGTREGLMGRRDVRIRGLGIASEQPRIRPGPLVAATRRTSCFPAARVTHSVPGLPFRVRRYFPETCTFVHFSSHADLRDFRFCRHTYFEREPNKRPIDRSSSRDVGFNGTGISISSSKCRMAHR